jgi:aspartyl-tRNA(Asn)/glutamyl-tRNA(Gln) amidotransferase subunit A
VNNKNFVKNPGQLKSIFKDIIAKKISPVELLESYISRIEKIQEYVEPWVYLDIETSRVIAKKREEQILKGINLGPLHGIPVAVKDIIHVKGMPTKFNSKAFQKNEPSQSDAEIVLALKSAGAIILGKAHTTEFAFLDPSPAKNPHNIDYTPGGSSSGSAAAVASGCVPLSIGTQTMASVNRPASYCGISAFKPSNRSMNGYGISPLAPSFDTVGFYGWDISDALYAFDSVQPNMFRFTNRNEKKVDNIIFIEDDLLNDMMPEMHKCLDVAINNIKQLGNRIVKAKSPFSMSNLNSLQRNIMIYEAGHCLNHLLEYPINSIGVRLRAAIVEGKNMEEEFYISQRVELNKLRGIFFEHFNKDDIFMWPAAPGAAPYGLSSTGDPKYIAPWTALAGPIITTHFDILSENGLPLGIILSSAPGSDKSLADFGNSLSAFDT